MGNVCCGAQGEAKKAGAFDSNSKNDIDDNRERQQLLLHNNQGGDNNNNNNDPYASALEQQQQQQDSLNPASPAVTTASANTTIASNNNNNNKTPEQQKQDLALELLIQKEQDRLALVVQAVGRTMVAVRSTRGSTGYYDQGFAAALSQHLEQTMPQQFPKSGPHGSVQLPPAPAPAPAITTTTTNNSNNNNVFSRLALPAWQGLQVGNKAGEDPNTYFDHVAETYLEDVSIKEKDLFRGVPPIVENLL